MNWLDYPDRRLWEERQHWFEELADSIEGEGSYLVSEQACALIGEVQTAFCVGSWIAVIVLALSVVDAQLRETELPQFRGTTKRLLDEVGASPALHRLRQRRNSIIHLDPQNPAITVDQQWADRSQLEEEARQAIRLMFEAFYMSPGV
jgi:hypothetical protein